LLAECRTLGGCGPGEARITRGHRLPARYVTHTVGPVWRGGGSGEPALLASCYRASLALADSHGLRTVALPAISCGVYGYPLAAACRIAVDEAARFLDTHAALESITFCCFDARVHAAYAVLLAASDFS
jgi:O-acetyl-ADP-ribose deacetylase (regulator of RNase III)